MPIRPLLWAALVYVPLKHPFYILLCLSVSLSSLPLCDDISCCVLQHLWHVPTRVHALFPLWEIISLVSIQPFQQGKRKRERERGRKLVNKCDLDTLGRKRKDMREQTHEWPRVRADRAPVLDPSSLESILVKSVSIEACSAESLVLSRLPWLTLSRSLVSAHKTNTQHSVS